MENRILHAASVIAVAAFLAACAPVEATPVASHEPASGVAEPAAQVAEPTPAPKLEARRIVVREGQSVSRVAVEYGVSKRAIIEANQLVEPYKLKAGQRLLIPGSAAAAAASPPPAVRKDREIVVEQGRSVGGIAAEYRVTKQVIIEANHLEPPYKIKAGQKLLIPNAAEPPPTMVAAAPLPTIAPAEATASANPTDPPAAATPIATAPSTEAAAAPPLTVAAAAQPAAGASEHRVAASAPEPVRSAAAAPGNRAPVNDEPLRAPAGVPPPTEAAAAPPAVEAAATPPPIPATAPPGVTCPPGTVGMMSVDVIKEPVFICRRTGSQG